MLPIEFIIKASSIVEEVFLISWNYIKLIY